MPRDPRPYVTYPLNYTGHPRVESMSDAAFRAFHEMNDYSRVQGLDGAIPTVVARKRWPTKVLAELVRGIDDRPLLVLTEDAYVLRSYAEHQFTTADAEALRTARAEAGRKGGEAKARAKQAASAALANAKQPASAALANAKQPGGTRARQSESESESELTLTDVTTVLESSPDSTARVLEADQAQDQLDARKLQAAAHAEALGIRTLGETRALLERTVDRVMTLDAALELAGAILARSRNPVKDPDAYLASVCRKSAKRVRDLWTQLDLEVVS